MILPAALVIYSGGNNHNDVLKAKAEMLTWNKIHHGEIECAMFCCLFHKCTKWDTSILVVSGSYTQVVLVTVSLQQLELHLRRGYLKYGLQHQQQQKATVIDLEQKNQYK